MQELNWKQVQQLNDSLNSTEVVEVQGQQVHKSVLKSGKDLDGETYLKLASVKKKLRNQVEDMIEMQKPIFEENDFVQANNVWALPQTENKEEIARHRQIAKDVSKKFDALYNSVKLEIPDAFIRKEEFLKWTKDCNIDVSSVLAEFLLVGFDKE